MDKYGKSSGGVSDIKSSFIDREDELFVAQKGVTDLYRRQPVRACCKNCGETINEILFTKQNVEYLLCPRCNHLNGAYEDSEEFCRIVYEDTDSQQYANNYVSANKKAYWDRVETIYTPKAEFLLDSLKSLDEDKDHLSFADIGAGSGYFIASMMSCGVTEMVGYETSPYQAKFANSMIGADVVTRNSIDEIEEVILDTRVNVISMIGVLEHLQKPRRILSAIAQNSYIKYFYFSVPLFSMSVFFDLLFQDNFQSQLAGRHTHLYTEKSINWFCNEFNFKRMSSWWFGSDVMHLHRHLIISLRKQNQPEAMIRYFEENLASSVDSMQIGLDKWNLSSEVHMLLKKPENSLDTKLSQS
jgi:hypothetical protein